MAIQQQQMAFIAEMAQDPEKREQLIAKAVEAGIEPPDLEGGGPGVGSAVQPTGESNMPVAQNLPISGAASGSFRGAQDVGIAQGPAGGGGGGSFLAGLMTALQGIKAPEGQAAQAPPRGAAPASARAGGLDPQMLALIMQLLQAQPGPQPQPTLGSLIGGGR